MSDNKQQINKGMQFLKVPYEYLKLIGTYEHEKNKIKIDTLDVLIISKISEFLDFNMECFISDDSLAELFRTSRSTIQRSIKNLKSLGFIKSNTYITHNTGQQTKHRSLTVNNDIIKASVINNKSKHQKIKKVASENNKASINTEAITEKEYKNNIKIKENNSSSSIPDGIKDIMKNIGINYQKNTDDELRKIIKNDIDYTVLNRLVQDNKASFLKHTNNGQNYLFGILKTLVRENYNKYQTKIQSERIEYESEIAQMKNEPQIDYTRIAKLSMNNSRNRGVDICELIDEIDMSCEENIKDINISDDNMSGIWEETDLPYVLDQEGNKVFSSPSLKMLYELSSVSKCDIEM